MLKKPVFFSIFILLFIGLSDYGYACHKGDDVRHGQKPCDDGNTDTGGEVGQYIVTISGGPGVEATTIDPWLGHKGEKMIAINNGRQHGDLPQFTDLSFFRDYADINEGHLCFTIEDEFLGQLEVGKGGVAVGQFWFDGFQKDGSTAARYYLTMFGTVSEKPPIGEGETFFMDMEDWELNVQGGNNIQNDSCMGEADASGGVQFYPKVVITVERCPVVGKCS